MQADRAEHPTIAELVQEGHLRLAVLLDMIDDDLTESGPVGARLAQLRMEYDRHALRQEQILAQHFPTVLNSHRRNHDRMRALLGRLGTEHAGGGDIRPLLDQVVGLFTGRLMPDDAVFRTMMEPAHPT